MKIGAASRQTLERIQAEHTARRADVQSAASRLELLGLSVSAIESLGPGAPVDATIVVPAPIAGVITERNANSGLNVDLATKLFTIVDLSTVWVVAELCGTGFARGHVGSAATVTTTAYPDLVLQGRVAYIDPQVSPETRTARVRVEVPNRRQELRFGMYAEVRSEPAAKAPSHKATVRRSGPAPPGIATPCSSRMTRNTNRPRLMGI